MNETIIEAGDISSGKLRGLAENVTPQTLIVAIPLLALTIFFLQHAAPGQPPILLDPIPFVFNTVQFLTNNHKFMKRAMKAFERSNVAKFYLATTPAYMISGQHNVQTIFGRSNKVGTEDIFEKSVFPVLYRMPKEFVQRFSSDKSGRGRNPAPGTGDIPKEKRYWATYEHVHSEYMARTQHLKPIMEAFRNQFTERLNKYPTGEWSTISVVDFCRREMTECAISTLFGPKVFELNPGFREAFWDFDDNVFMLTLGFPRWLNPGPYRVHDRYLAMIEKYVHAASVNFDWEGPDMEAHWEPHFGARVCREIAKWFRRDGFPDQAIAGALGTLLFAQNSNTIPSTMWCIIEICKDPSLLQAIREEVATAYVENEMGKRTIDIQKLVSLPLLQSVFTEVLRMHMNFNIIRHVKESVTMDGHTIGKGCMVQAPMMVAHYDESVWGSAGHPATEFCAERHVKYVEEKDEFGNISRKRTFAMAGRPSSYFPFGGGPPICPGRHLAKHEILTAIALLVSKFDIEFVEWTKADGSTSSEPAQNDPKYCGNGAQPPTRDMRLRVKRLY